MCEECDVPDYLLRDLPVAPDPKQFPPEFIELRAMRMQSQRAHNVTVVFIASIASFLMGLIAGFIAGYF